MSVCTDWARRCLKNLTSSIRFGVLFESNDWIASSIPITVPVRPIPAEQWMTVFESFEDVRIN